MTHNVRASGAALLVVALAAGAASTGHALVGAPHPKPPHAAVRAATASARRALLRRSDLGAGWSAVSAAPPRSASLTCAADRSVLAAAASATWSQRSVGVFVSGTSYGYATGAQERRAWARTATGGMGRCLERVLADGSGHGVRLRAGGVRRLPAPHLVPGAHGLAVRRYRVSGVANGNGQQTSVALDVVLVAAGTWIAEDEFTAAGAPPAAGLEARVAGVQVRRAMSSLAH
ncbi:MAG TPA: hypothetical protein VIY10_01575 [Solirubrobacteraceae bacterium]